jgi:PIN domain nuclease of toxin-antitoxin system
MRFLLDTHTLLWAWVEPDKLSAKVRKLIENPRNTRVVSSVSALEIATKFRIGKLPEAEDVVREFARHLRTFVADELPVTSKHALTAGLFAAPHRDPFDRILAAQSIVESIPLVTCDEAFAAFHIETLW